ncbi:hypothetical protein C5S31_08000 [ANME-1 cluster archaeon GoMg2]|nr:hypothetical protein [ANME-1 cluster archaeon GoMg2]
MTLNPKRSKIFSAKINCGTASTMSKTTGLIRLAIASGITVEHSERAGYYFESIETVKRNK